MKIMFSAFGIRHYSNTDLAKKNAFYRMPPLRMDSPSNTFSPDYGVLFLASCLVLDQECWSKILKKDYHSAFERTAEILMLLHAEGRVEIKDYNGVLEEKHVLHSNMLNGDLSTLDNWIPIMRESRTQWESYVKRMPWSNINTQSTSEYHVELKEKKWLSGAPIHFGPIIGDNEPFWENELPAYNLSDETLRSQKTRIEPKHRKIFVKHLRHYLNYVNANLILANTFDVGIHDWSDYDPFYKAKFLSVGVENQGSEINTETANKLFKIFIPEIDDISPKKIVEAIVSNESENFRTYIDELMNSGQEIDQNYANKALGEALQLERRIKRNMRILSWVTLPLDFLPFGGAIATKVVEETASITMEKKHLEKYKWLYFLSDLDNKASQVAE